MASAKEIIIKPISSIDANRIIRTIHYSHKVVNNSQLHFGVFLNGKCGGVLQFGPSLDKRKIMRLVRETGWNEFLELNRMALADWMPKNSGSRALSVCIRLIRQHYPYIKWIISFADGTQCGHGTQYQAVGFYLTGIKRNNQIWQAPTGARFSRTSLTDGRSKAQQRQAVNLCYRVTVTKGSNILESGGASMKSFIDSGFKPLLGYQFRYIYFLDLLYKDKLTVPILPYSKIDEVNGRMYKGKLISGVGSIDNDAATIHAAEGGVTPTPTLQNFIGQKAVKLDG